MKTKPKVKWEHSLTFRSVIFPVSGGVMILTRTGLSSYACMIDRPSGVEKMRPEWIFDHFGQLVLIFDRLSEIVERNGLEVNLYAS